MPNVFKSSRFVGIGRLVPVLGFDNGNGEGVTGLDEGKDLEEVGALDEVGASGEGAIEADTEDPLQAARREADRIVQEARRLVEEESERRLTALTASWAAELQRTTDAAVAAREALFAECTPQILKLALEVAEKILQRECEADPGVVLTMVKEAIARLSHREQVRVKINVADLPVIEQRKEEILNLLEGVRHLEIVSDDEVTQGGCLVESPRGAIVDARLGTQLAEVSHQLLLAGGDTHE